MGRRVPSHTRPHFREMEAEHHARSTKDYRWGVSTLQCQGVGRKQTACRRANDGKTRGAEGLPLRGATCRVRTAQSDAFGLCPETEAAPFRGGDEEGEGAREEDDLSPKDRPFCPQRSRYPFVPNPTGDFLGWLFKYSRVEQAGGRRRPRWRRRRQRYPMQTLLIDAGGRFPAARSAGEKEPSDRSRRPGDSNIAGCLPCSPVGVACKRRRCVR